MIRLISMLLFLVVILPTMALAQEAITVEGFWPFLEQAVPAWVVIMLIAIRQVSEVIAKSIPDTETGTLATVRRIFKVLAIYIPNKT